LADVGTGEAERESAVVFAPLTAGEMLVTRTGAGVIRELGVYVVVLLLWRRVLECVVVVFKGGGGGGMEREELDVLLVDVELEEELVDVGVGVVVGVVGVGVGVDVDVLLGVGKVMRAAASVTMEMARKCVDAASAVKVVKAVARPEPLAVGCPVALHAMLVVPSRLHPRVTALLLLVGIHPRERQKTRTVRRGRRGRNRPWQDPAPAYTAARSCRIWCRCRQGSRRGMWSRH
jgi:hypothetical protein